jgi:ElaA protein
MNDKLKWVVKYFEDLTAGELYDNLYLRNEVFVVEQNAIYLDTDYKDQKALHILGYVNDKLAAYCRIFRPGDYFKEACIGRVVVSPQYRKYGYGHQLMDKAIELMRSEFNETKITISAQLYLKDFYESHGFEKTSDTYLEDGIPHIQMKKK